MGLECGPPVELVLEEDQLEWSSVERILLGGEEGVDLCDRAQGHLDGAGVGGGGVVGLVEGLRGGGRWEGWKVDLLGFRWIMCMCSFHDPSP